MNPIVRYTLLFMIWFGTVFGFYLHNKPAESIEPVQSPEPLVQIRESEAQNVTLQVLRAKMQSLETTVEVQTQTLRDLEAKNEALESQNSKLPQKTKSSTPKAETPKPAPTAVAQHAQREPIRPSAPKLSLGRPTQAPLAQRQPLNSGNVLASLPPGGLNRYLNEAANRSKRCSGRGNLVLRLTVGNNGRLNRVSVTSGSLKGTATERCIINEFKNQTFPKFKNPAAIDTTYTVRL